MELYAVTGLHLRRESQCNGGIEGHGKGFQTFALEFVEGSRLNGPPGKHFNDAVLVHDFQAQQEKKRTDLRAPSDFDIRRASSSLTETPPMLTHSDSSTNADLTEQLPDDPSDHVSRVRAEYGDVLLCGLGTQFDCHASIVISSDAFMKSLHPQIASLSSRRRRSSWSWAWIRICITVGHLTYGLVTATGGADSSSQCTSLTPGDTSQFEKDFRTAGEKRKRGRLLQNGDDSKSDSTQRSKRKPKYEFGDALIDKAKSVFLCPLSEHHDPDYRCPSREERTIRATEDHVDRCHPDLMTADAWKHLEHKGTRLTGQHAWTRLRDELLYAINAKQGMGALRRSNDDVPTTFPLGRPSDIVHKHFKTVIASILREDMDIIERKAQCIVETWNLKAECQTQMLAQHRAREDYDAASASRPSEIPMLALEDEEASLWNCIEPNVWSGLTASDLVTSAARNTQPGRHIGKPHWAYQDSGYGTASNHRVSMFQYELGSRGHGVDLPAVPHHTSDDGLTPSSSNTQQQPPQARVQRYIDPSMLQVRRL